MRTRAPVRSSLRVRAGPSRRRMAAGLSPRSRRRERPDRRRERPDRPGDPHEVSDADTMLRCLGGEAPPDGGQCTRPGRTPRGRARPRSLPRAKRARSDESSPRVLRRSRSLGTGRCRSTLATGVRRAKAEDLVTLRRTNGVDVRARSEHRRPLLRHQRILRGGRAASHSHHSEFHPVWIPGPARDEAMERLVVTSSGHPLLKSASVTACGPCVRTQPQATTTMLMVEGAGQNDPERFHPVEKDDTKEAGHGCLCGLLSL